VQEQTVPEVPTEPGTVRRVGRTPGYSRLVLAYAKHLKLRVGRVVRRAGRITVQKVR
jgi:hypothetical protein